MPPTDNTSLFCDKFMLFVGYEFPLRATWLYSGHFQMSMKIFCENNSRLKTVNHFPQKQLIVNV